MPAGGVEVGGGGLAGRGGGEVGQEQRALLAAGQVPGQQPGGPGLPADETPLTPASSAIGSAGIGGRPLIVDGKASCRWGPRQPG